MKKGVLVMSILFLVCFSYSIYGQEATSSDEGISISANKCAIGINDLPWRASTVSFKWWKDEHRGRELSVGGLRGNISRNDEDMRIDARISSIRYDWLRRKEFTQLKGAYITRGVGITVGFGGQLSETDRDEAYQRENRQGYLSSSIHIPVGIEHFFLRRYPKISYSLQVDFYGELGYKYLYAKYGTSPKRESHRGSVSLGVSPQFYLWFYLK